MELAGVRAPTSLRPPAPPARGRFATARRALQALVLAGLAAAPFLDLLRVDLVAGRLIVLGRSLHPGKDLWAVYGLLLVGLLWIFGGALIHGRLWCGWLCPQTLGSELAARWQARVLGSGRAARRTPARETLYGGGIVLGSATFAALLVNLFLTPAQRWAPPAPAWIALGVLAALLAADFLWVRHAYCLRLCPYGVLLQLVQDRKTLRVELPEGERAACLSCRACERACFMGVDVRDRSRHTEAACLLCGLCVDACNRVFARRGRPGLLTFAFASGRPGWPAWLSRVGLSDARRLGLTLVTVGVALATLVFFRTREPLSVTAATRYAEARRTPDGQVLNTVDLTLSNDGEAARSFRLDVRAGDLALAPPEPARVTVEAGARVVVPVVLRLATGAQASPGAHPVELRLEPVEGGEPLLRRATFFVPGAAGPR